MKKVYIAKKMYCVCFQAGAGCVRECVACMSKLIGKRPDQVTGQPSSSSSSSTSSLQIKVLIDGLGDTRVRDKDREPNGPQVSPFFFFFTLHRWRRGKEVCHVYRAFEEPLYRINGHATGGSDPTANMLLVLQVQNSCTSTEPSGIFILQIL